MLFRLRVREVPSGGSIPYPSIEARCRACVVNDGDEPMCVSLEQSIVEQQAAGQPCPYRPPVITDEDTLVRLVQLATVPELGHVFQSVVNTRIAPRPDADLRVNMIVRAVTDPRAVEHLVKSRKAAN